jgi:hypothetical protein
VAKERFGPGWRGDSILIAFQITSISKQNSVPASDAAACVYDGSDLQHFLLLLEIAAAGYTYGRASTTWDVSNPRGSRLLVRKSNAAQGAEKHPYDTFKITRLSNRRGGGSDNNIKAKLMRATVGSHWATWGNVWR